ncbi:MAG: hypothetical protein WCA49_12240 [Candidatus Sulfotelmatobacter sp.]
MVPSAAEKLRKEDLRLSVVELTPSGLQSGANFEAVIRLTNNGGSSVRVPWEVDGEKVVRTSSDGKEEGYEVVDLILALGAGRHRTAPVSLKAAGALFADPELAAGGIELPPGQWVDVKIKGKAECANTGSLCDNIVADDEGELVARWYERVSAHRINGCDEDHGNFVRRELESKPLRVAVRPPTATNR